MNPILAIALILVAARHDGEPVFPGKDWAPRTLAEVGLDAAKLDALREHVGGRGCVVCRGYLAYSWGDVTKRADVASACKPLFTHFLLLAVQHGKLKSVDEPVADFEPLLKDLNAELKFKDRSIRWRDLANQTSCYGVREVPGSAFDYSDYNMALFPDTLFLKVYGTKWDRVDRNLLGPQLTDIIGCQDEPTLLAFGEANRPGRLGISPRDFCRFGLLYLHKGRWAAKPLLDEKYVQLATTSPLPGNLPRTKGEAAEMIRGQRSLGGKNNQCDHRGSYSFAWWVNGVDKDGKRNWPHAPSDTFAASGHGGKRVLVVMPALELVASWNDARIDDEAKLAEAMKRLAASAGWKGD
jgi:hypothetical protein